MRRTAIVCVVFLVISAGCAAVPFGQRGPVPLELENAHNVKYTFEVWEVKYPSNMTVQRDDGVTATGPIGPGLVTTDPGENRTYVAVELPNSSRLHARTTLEPGGKNRILIDPEFQSFTIFVKIYQGESIVHLVSANCDNDLDYFEIAMRYYGADAAYICKAF